MIDASMRLYPCTDECLSNALAAPHGQFAEIVTFKPVVKVGVVPIEFDLEQVRDRPAIVVSGVRRGRCRQLPQGALGFSPAEIRHRLSLEMSACPDRCGRSGGFVSRRQELGEFETSLCAVVRRTSVTFETLGQ